MNETLGKTNSSSICNKYVVIVSVCYLENILRMKSHTLIKEDDCIKDVCTDFSPILPLPLRLPLFPFPFESGHMWLRMASNFMKAETGYELLIIPFPLLQGSDRRCVVALYPSCSGKMLVSDVMWEVGVCHAV